MVNSQRSKTGNGKGSQADTSEDLTKSLPSVNMAGSASKSSPAGITASTPNASRSTWTNAALEELQSKAGIVAGAIADFQTVGGLVAVKNVEYKPGEFAVRVILFAKGLDVKYIDTDDGADLVAVMRVGDGS